MSKSTNTPPEFFCSVVIPTYRRPALLLKCLKALQQQTLPVDQFDVTVVDDGNDPATLELVRAFTEQFGLQITYLGQPEGRGPAAARNRGWRAASGNLIAFTDDDCLPQPDWLQQALTAFRNGAIVASGRVVMPLPNQPSNQDHTTALLETAEFVTANCFCTRSSLELVGGFDEAYPIAWREDSALQFAFLEAGIPITPCPQALIVHPLRTTDWYAPLKVECKNQYDALLYSQYPTLFRERIPQYRGLVTAYYGTVGSALLAMGGLATGQRSLAQTGGISWLLITTALLIRQQSGESLNGLPKNLALSVATPFLSVYWRLYGSFKYRVWRL